MKNNFLALFSCLLLLFFITSCQEDGDFVPDSGGFSNVDDRVSGAFEAGSSSGSTDPGNGQGGGDLDGLITAAEWNDQENWDFWLDLTADTTYTADMERWGWDPTFFPGIQAPRNASGQLYQIAFIVDATGSMGDELEYLKDDLESVISRVEEEHPTFQVETGAVFYRDQTDEYLTRHSAFSTDIVTTTEFIAEQSANGGGDWPEAVHSGLATSLNELSWAPNAGSKLAFLILDAPPHEDQDVLSEYRNLVESYGQSGIRIVPVTASGIDRATEFLMRMTAIRTDGTYVFITDDSGIGNDHLEPTVGEYEVQFLGDLLVKLICRYGEGG